MYCLVLMEGTQLTKNEALLPGKVRQFNTFVPLDQCKYFTP